MLRLRSLELENFGPYKGTQRLAFADQPGVELVWGENGRGKTTLLNALRWALFGQVLGRGSKQANLMTIANSEAEEGGAEGFKVVLAFSQDGHEYRLTRAFRPRTVGQPGLLPSDFVQQVSLIRDGDVLGPEEREWELARLLPQQIARFFLFDAELLLDYEQLVSLESEVGERLKSAIERILGVPILTHARRDIGQLLAEARQAQAKAAQRDKNTRDLGNSLQIAEEQAQAAEKNVNGLSDKVQELKLAVSDLEKQLALRQRYRDRMVKRDAKQNEVERLEERHNNALDDLQALTGDAWRSVLGPTINHTLAEVDAQIEKLQSAHRAAIAARDEAQRLRIMQQEGRCPTCQQPIHEEHLGDFQARVEEHSGEDLESTEAELGELFARRQALAALSGGDRGLALAERAVEQTLVDLTDAEHELTELKEALHGAPEEEVLDLVQEHASTVTSLSNTRQRLMDARKELERKERAAFTLSERLRKLGAGSTGAEDRRVAVLIRLQELLEAAVRESRERLRDQVQIEATEVFRVLSSEPDYDHLGINDNYGLTIMYANGKPVENRSSGYEHLVAVALIAALQRCSSVEGPIITDSPFGRLDRENKRHMLETLPNLSEQVILLVHDEELDRGSALEALGPTLMAEHHLRRINARHTEIESGALR